MHHDGSSPRSKFLRDGWVTIESAVDLALLDRIRADIVRTFGYQFRRHGIPAPQAWDRNDLFHRMRELFAASPSTFFSTARLAQCMPSIMALAGSECMLRALGRAGLSDPGFVLIPNIVFMSSAFRVEGGYNRRPPHQDWLSMQGSLDGVVAWIPLHDVGPTDYPLELWSGTHLLGPLLSERSDCGTRIVDPRLPSEPPVPLVMRYGDVNCMSCFMAHRTGEGPGDSMRVSIILRYNNLAEPTFAERGFPMPSTMQVAREPIAGSRVSDAAVLECFLAGDGDGRSGTVAPAAR